MKFIWTDDAVNLIPLTNVVEVGNTGPEARDLEDQLGTIELHELDVLRDLEVLPHVVRDRAADVSLQVRMVRKPAS